MLPNASGITSLDQDQIINLALKVRDLTFNHGRFGTCLVIKVWQTDSVLMKFTDLLKEDFKDVQHFKPDASRKDSAEIYIVACSLIKSPV
jgi:23S rRNA (uridine2552-2'-O)-methyltransferase